MTMVLVVGCGVGDDDEQELRSFFRSRKCNKLE